MTSSPMAVFHASNLLTYGSLLCGIAAMSFALDGAPGAAGACLAAAVVLDTFDGRFARLFTRSDAQQALGVQLDSLSDAIAFGMAPAVCAALLAGRDEAGTIWPLAAFLYGAAAVTRLAFYNTTHADHEGFIGLPVPVAALVWASAMLFAPRPGVTAILACVTAAAMVLPLPIPRPRGVGLAAFVCWPLLVIAAHLSSVFFRVLP